MTEEKVRKKRGRKIGMSEDEQKKFLLLAEKVGFKTKKALAKFLEMTSCGLSLALKEKRLNKYLVEFFELKLLVSSEEKQLSRALLNKSDAVSGVQHFQD